MSTLSAPSLAPAMSAAPRPRDGVSHSLRAWGLRLLLIAALIGAVLYGRQNLIGDSKHPRTRVQRVTLVTPQRHTPPPKEDKPKEIEKPKAEIDVNEPVMAPPPGQKPQDDQLGVDADGEGAGDGFGLVAKRGGQDIITLGEGSGGGTGGVSPAAERFNYNVYAGTVRQRLQNELSSVAALREQEYVAIVQLWISPRGKVERVELPKGSGLIDIDSALRQALGSLPVLPEPPSGLPQPLRLRITSRELHG